MGDDSGSDFDWENIYEIEHDKPTEALSIATESVKEKKAEKMTAQQREWMINAIYDRICTQKPWNAVEPNCPDTLWHTPSFEIESWGHLDATLEVSDGICYFTFDRPNENNSMNDSLGMAISEILMLLPHRPDIRIGVFTGNGRMYCSGADPKAWQAAAAAAKGIIMDGDGTTARRVATKPASTTTQRHLNKLGKAGQAMGAFPNGIEISRVVAAKQWHTWSLLPQFTISLANGSAMGGGVGCMCCCDYIICVKRAFIVLSEVKIGVIPATISPYVIAKMGASNAKRLFTTAENMSADRSKDVKIVDEVVNSVEEGHKKIRELALLFTACAPKAANAVKEIVMTVAGQPITEEVMFYTGKKFIQHFEGEEGKDGMAAVEHNTSKPWEDSSIKCLY